MIPAPPACRAPKAGPRCRAPGAAARLVGPERDLNLASAAGIGRRTFFRYFPSKNDVPWGNFDEELDRMHRHLKASARRPR